jgi:sialate O-acetylesterase
MKKSFFIFVIIFQNFSFCAKADIILPAIFNDHMVLQQNAEVTIWGWGKPGEKIKITASWDTAAVHTTTDPNAHWRIKIRTPEAGGPHQLTFEGFNNIILNDVMLGEVWLCSGQSNMEWTAKAGIDNAEQAIQEANIPQIRFFSVGHKTADTRQLDLKGEWVVSTPETMKNFSAVAYFFGQRLNDLLNVPIGLINSSWGGTPAEVWVNSEVIASEPLLAEAAGKLKEVPWGPVMPGKAFNAMIAPLIPYNIAGAIWYQGESNVGSPETYTSLLQALIVNWRNEWGYQFPFYFVQIAPFKYGQPEQGVQLREAQRQVEIIVPETGMVVISDIGNTEDIHPTNKQDVGLRLANLALNKTYGKSDIPYSGPRYRDMAVEGNKVRLFFDNAENGLIFRGGALTDFEIAGEDNHFFKATAKIEGNSIIVRSKEVKNPVKVRYGWSNTATPDLFNKEGLPTSSFRTDNGIGSVVRK